MTQKDWKQYPFGIYHESKNTCFRPKIDHERSKKWRWSWKIIKVCSHNGSFRSELNSIMTQKDWKHYPNGIYQGSKSTCFRPKIDHERSKKSRWSRKIIKLCSHNGSFRSELSKAMTQKDWKQYPIGIYHESKNTCFRPKIDHKRSKNWRRSWKIIKFCSHNGSFRSELNSIMTQKDWKQDPIGIYQGSKNTSSRPKIDHERSKKCRWSWKIIEFCSPNGNFRSELSKIMTQKDWKQYPIGMYQGSKNYMFQN